MLSKTLTLSIIALLIGVNIISIINAESATGNQPLTNNCSNGYTLCSVQPIVPNDKFNDMFNLSSHILLIDMDGNIVKKWSSGLYHAKMLPNGSILSKIVYNDETRRFSNLTQLGWNGSVEWNFDCNWIDENSNLIYGNHHDFQREGNPVGYYAPGQDFTENGKTLILAHKNTYNPHVSWREFKDDVIYEVDWNGSLTGFEWHASDHIDEMGFDLKSRIGMWINPGGLGRWLMIAIGDLLHINTISYLGKNKWYDMGYEEFNPNNIMITSRHANFLIIIEKETGDIVWRIGPNFLENPEENKLGQIIGPHHAHIIPDGLPGAGNILVFDNGGLAGYGLFGNPNKFRLYSKVIEFNPLTNEIVWVYQFKNGLSFLIRQGKYHKFFSITMSSAQRLPNGNTLITEGFTGRVFEVTPDNEVVWEYLVGRSYKIYRAYRIPPEWVPGNPAKYPFFGSENT